MNFLDTAENWRLRRWESFVTDEYYASKFEINNKDFETSETQANITRFTEFCFTFLGYGYSLNNFYA